VKSQGADVATTQGLMRHANPGITMQTYVQAVTPAKREAHARLVNSIPFPDKPAELEAKTRAARPVPVPNSHAKIVPFPNVPTSLTEVACS
jgi:hypothetical protein